MSATDIKVLEQILSESRHQIASEMPESDYFQYFSALQVLRGQALDPDEIQSGIIDGDKTGSDGGIDGFYLFVNGRLIREQDEADGLRALKQNVQMDLVLVQATTHAGFELTRLTRLKGTVEDMLTLDRAPDKFGERYSDSLLTSIEVFRTAHRVLVPKFPVFKVRLYLVTQGDTSEIAPDVRSTADHLANAVRQLLATVRECTVGFLGARELIELSTKPPKLTFELKCVDSVSSGKNAYVSLVKLTDFYSLIRGENGEFLTHLFEANVRDYQGDIAVNEAIRETLEHPFPNEQFWWLNNGITIVAEKVGGHVKELVIDEPQVVNGLQTSQEVFKYFSTHPEAATAETRELIVKTIGSSSEVHDHIIRATNSQTSIPPASLWATERIHRDIEQMFKSAGLYYDRRKNSWRRQGISLSKVVGITELAQSVAAIYLQEPDQARARPSRYFTRKYHSTIFNSKFDISMYAACAHIRKRAEGSLRSLEPDKGHRNNLLFYVMLAGACLKMQLPRARPKTIGEIDYEGMDTEFFAQVLRKVRPLYQKYGGDDRAARGTEFVADLKKSILEWIIPAKKKKKKKK